MGNGEVLMQMLNRQIALVAPTLTFLCAFSILFSLHLMIPTL